MTKFLFSKNQSGASVLCSLQFIEQAVWYSIQKTIAIVKATCFESMDKYLSWLPWKILSDPTNIINIVNEEAQSFVTSNQQPRFLASGKGWISESPTRILVLSSFSSCCDEPMMRNSVVSLNLRSLFNFQKRMFVM